MKLKGKVALVTGASRGIGRAIALALAEAGAAVAVNYRARADRAGDVLRTIQSAGGTGIAVAADVADYAQVEAMVQRTLSDLGGLHILVNNAGVAKDGLLFNLDAADWFDVMRVNFGGVFHCTKASIGHMMAQRDGVIVNVSSVMAERGWIGQSNYAASKAAVNAFTRCCAMELSRFGVRVNAVLSGFVDTDLVHDLLERDGGDGIVRQIPLRTIATPEQLARVVAFLAGPDAGYVTGALVTVDGGTSSMLGVGAPLR